MKCSKHIRTSIGENGSWDSILGMTMERENVLKRPRKYIKMKSNLLEVVFINTDSD